jgi:glucosamine--fructose-6-phosphate aminotransferase (isomerizing)
LQHWAGRRLALEVLPEAAATLIRHHQQECLEYGANAGFQQFYFLGSGYRHGLASEASLKMKEMSLSTSEPFHHMEYRHGPQSMVNPQTLILSLGSLRMHSQEQAVLADMRALGGHTLSIGGHADQHMRWQLSDSDSYDGILALPLLQSIAFARSTSRGLDPDNPHNLNAVVVL